MPTVSIVIPAYNEASNLARTVEHVSANANELGMDYEIILVNDGSLDQTEAVARELAKRLPHIRLVRHWPNRGYGGALKAGHAAASKDWIAIFPADGQFDFSEIQRLLAKTGQAELICGYRQHRRDAFTRLVNAWGWNSLVRLLFGYLCRDIDCGFKLFRRDILAQVSLESNGAMIDTEFLVGARAHGYRIAEVPVTHLQRAGGKATGAKPAVILSALRDLLRFRFKAARKARLHQPALHIY
jgi:glycosyltransferase involved in cell wall biosynthesis